MILDALVDPIQVWQEAERYLTLGARTYSRFSAIMEASRRYCPEVGDPTFLLESFWLTYDDGVYLSNGDSRLTSLYQQDDRFLFLVHPDTMSLPSLYCRRELEYGDRGPSVEVVPSANVRTVFVRRIGDELVEGHFVKLHFPRRISRFVRDLDRNSIEHQISCTRRLANAGIPVLLDIGGGVLGSDRERAWGYIVRERTSRNASEVPFTIPLFSLYSRDTRRPDDPILLVQLVSNARIAGFMEALVRTMVHLWVTAVEKAGCFVELHSQNTLLMFSDRADSWQVAYRDGDVYSDADTTRTAGQARADLSECPVANGAFPREQLLSLTYDTFLGHHALAYLARAAYTGFGLEESFISDVAKSAFKEAGASALELPPTCFTYDDRLYPNGECHLINTGMLPIWR